MDLRIQEMAAEQVPWIFLVNPGWREAFKKGWAGFHWYPDNNVHFDWLYKSRQYRRTWPGSIPLPGRPRTLWLGAHDVQVPEVRGPTAAAACPCSC